MPHDELIRFADGTTAWVRFAGPRPKPRPCICCRRPSSLQCDYPLLHGGTCDAYLCRACGVAAGPDRDYCPSHGMR
jgi:hypothetical protein